MSFLPAVSSEDSSLSKQLKNIATNQQRHYVVMEVKGNLLKAERNELREQFVAQGFKTVSLILMGEPPVDFKRKSQEMILASKQETTDAEFHKKLEEQKRQRQLEKRQKDLERMKRKGEKQAKKTQEERRRKLEEELRKNLAQLTAEKE